MKFYEAIVYLKEYKIGEGVYIKNSIDEMAAFQDFGYAIHCLEKSLELCINRFFIEAKEKHYSNIVINKKYMLAGFEESMDWTKELHDPVEGFGECKFVSNVCFEYTDENSNDFCREYSFELYEREMDIDKED